MRVGKLHRSDTARCAVALVVLSASCKQVLGLEDPELDPAGGGATSSQSAGPSGAGASMTSSGSSTTSSAGGASTASAGGGGAGPTTASSTATATVASSSSVGNGGGATSYADVILADGPLGYWRFGESGGLTAADETAGNHDGTYALGITLGVAGAIAGDPNTAAHFNGNTSVTMGDNFDFPGSASYSLEAWVKPGNVSGFDFIMAKEGPVFDQVTQTTKRQGYTLWVSSTNGTGTERILDEIKDDSGFGMMPASNKFSHVVATFSGTAHQLKLYLDGVEVGSDPGLNVLLDNAVGFSVGADEGGDGGNFLGDIDEVAVYDYTLTPQQVAAHHTAGL